MLMPDDGGIPEPSTYVIIIKEQQNVNMNINTNLDKTCSTV
jgi:hypothetical protein